jgi:hypothetical protein
MGFAKQIGAERLVKVRSRGGARSKNEKAAEKPRLRRPHGVRLRYYARAWSRSTAQRRPASGRISAGMATPNVIAAAMIHGLTACAANANAFTAADPASVPTIAGRVRGGTLAPGLAVGRWRSGDASSS